MAARIPTATTPRRRDYTFLVERMIPRPLLTRESDVALSRALALGEREGLFSESVSALRELVDRGLYVEIPSEDPGRLVFRSTRTRDRVHLVQPAAKQQASRPTPDTVSQTTTPTQPRSRATLPPAAAVARKPTPAPTVAPDPRKQHEAVARGSATVAASRQPATQSPGDAARSGASSATAPEKAPSAPVAATTPVALARLEPILQIIAIETRLAHLADRLRRILVHVEQMIPGTRARLWHLEGVSDEELGDGSIRELSGADLEAAPHFREALRTNATRYATRPPRGAEPRSSAVAAAVPLRVGPEPWGVLEIIWEQGTLQSINAFAPLLQPLARLVELAIRNQATLEKLVFVDPLTGVYNRAFYERQLALEMERAHRTNRKFGLLVMDVDDFKSINDRFGHRAGDAVLSQIAGEIHDRMRKIDLLFRYGGEEFVLLLPGAEQQEARRTAERLRAVVSEKRFAVEGVSEPLRVTVSVGIAIYPDDSRTQSGLFKYADAALYRAKEQGKNRVHYQS